VVQAFLEADAPRVGCGAHGVVVAAVPGARPGAWFTRGFEDTCAWLAVHTSRSAVAELLRVAWRTVGRVCARVADEQDARTDRFAGLRRIGVDEIAYKKGHRYRTVVVDHDSGRLIWAAPGRDEQTLEGFFDALGDDRACQLTHRSADAAAWIANVAARRCPQAVGCLDPFHVAGVGHRRPGCGPPRDLEHRPQGRGDRRCHRAQGRQVRAAGRTRRT